MHIFQRYMAKKWNLFIIPWCHWVTHYSKKNQYFNYFSVDITKFHRNQKSLNFRAWNGYWIAPSPVNKWHKVGGNVIRIIPESLLSVGQRTNAWDLPIHERLMILHIYFKSTSCNKFTEILFHYNWKMFIKYCIRE